jgi:hypothetical protein
VGVGVGIGVTVGVIVGVIVGVTVSVFPPPVVVVVVIVGVVVVVTVRVVVVVGDFVLSLQPVVPIVNSDRAHTHISRAMNLFMLSFPKKSDG